MSWKDAVGKRCLVKPDGQSLAEVTVLEISPAGENVKVRTKSGNEFWENVSRVTLLEVLASVESPVVDNP